MISDFQVRSVSNDKHKNKNLWLIMICKHHRLQLQFFGRNFRRYTSEFYTEIELKKELCYIILNRF